MLSNPITNTRPTQSVWYIAKKYSHKEHLLLAIAPLSVKDTILLENRLPVMEEV